MAQYLPQSYRSVSLNLETVRFENSNDANVL